VKQSFFAGLLGSFVGVALLLMIMNAAGLVSAQGPDIRSGEAPADRITVEAQPLTPTGGGGPNVAIGTTFSYQGQLKVSGMPYTGNCDMQFALWNGYPGSGILITTVLPIPAPVPVVNGLFVVYLNFGDQFQGDNRAIEPQVRCPAGSGTYQTLDAQVAYPTPYALSLRPGATISGSLTGSALTINNFGAGTAGVLHTKGDDASVVAFNEGEGPALLAISTNGYGLEALSASTSAAGLVAANQYLTGTAILLEGGGIRVHNAGINSPTPVFIHQVRTGGTGNICVGVSHATVLNNPLINGKAGAILIVTPNNGPITTGVTSPLHPVNVIYDDNNTCGFGIGRWIIADAATPAQALVNGQRFNVLAVLP
jgi:hypothetical protein